jgi:hypothetical protein
VAYIGDDGHIRLQTAGHHFGAPQSDFFLHCVHHIQSERQFGSGLFQAAGHLGAGFGDHGQFRRRGLVAGQLRALGHVAISGGEHEYTLHGFRQALDLRAFDPFQWGRCSEDLPTTTTSAPGGDHIQATLEVYFSVNGDELRPAPGGVYRVVYDDAASSPRVTCD